MSAFSSSDMSHKEDMDRCDICGRWFLVSELGEQNTEGTGRLIVCNNCRDEG